VPTEKDKKIRNGSQNTVQKATHERQHMNEQIKRVPGNLMYHTYWLYDLLFIDTYFNMSNMTCANSGTGTAYPAEAHEFTPRL
jgi:hypothetical protein